jgi:pilus assembly protein Flp/PilA
MMVPTCDHIISEENAMLTNLRNLLADESGATAIEYGLIAALVSVAAIGALQAMGTSLNSIFTTVCTKLSGAVTPGTVCAIAP